MTPNGDDRFDALLAFLKESRGFDFSGYKRASLERRIRRRMETVGTDTFESYLEFLELHPDEYAALFDTILINVTSFFRDGSAWEHLRDNVLPPLVAAKPADAPVRAWIAGCATGEEAYTVAMVLAEVLGERAFLDRVKIYATDVDEHALDVARLGQYTSRQLEPLGPELVERYFETTGSHLSFRKDLRRTMIFGRHDLVQDAPISKIDLLSCRNALMYFNAETQGAIVRRFHFALDPDGVLFLGKAEMLLSHTALFRPVDLKRRIFAKVSTPSFSDGLRAITGGGDGDGGDDALAEVIPTFERDALSTLPLAAVIVDEDGRVAVANERARALFALGTDDLGRRFSELELSYRPAELRSVIEQAVTERRVVVLDDVTLYRDGEPHEYEVQVTPLLPQHPGAVTITFGDVTRYRHLQAELEQANKELETAYEELQSTNEELETTNEELQSTVEELETTNEEIQSTNEELETMNEELHSTNEELQTINDELRERTTELNDVNGFLEAILLSLREGVVVVDGDLHVLVWNRGAELLWGLRTEEVRQRNVLELDVGVDLAPFEPQLRACLAGREERAELTVDARNRKGQPIRCRLTCSPLRRSDDVVRGLVIFTEDVTGLQAD